MDKSNLYKNLPDSPGVYLMKDGREKVIYVGKAGNIKRRVSSYFSRIHDLRIERLVLEIKKIDYRKTDSALEALILESRLIKQLAPKFNVKEKDDKSFLYVEITKEKFPRVLLARGRTSTKYGRRVKDEGGGPRYGPFASAASIREALKILRRIFPWSSHDPERGRKFARPCFDYEIGLCPGTCIGVVNRRDYLKNIGRLKLFFEGKKINVLKSLQTDMEKASKNLEFEKAEKLRRQIFALRHIRDTALIGEEPILHSTFYVPRSHRIEGYDISNISGTSAVGSMVVFVDGEPDKDQYRKFRIRMSLGPNDAGMMREMLIRRFSKTPPAGGWPLPDLILVDGGVPQINAARSALRGRNLVIPILGIVKGPTRKRNDILGIIPRSVDRAVLIRVRDEAHRFAIAYHKKLRRGNFIPKPEI